jgi:hypothetical protein
MRNAIVLALPLGAAFLFAGCSSGARTTAAAPAQPAPIVHRYVASPTAHWEALNDARREAAGLEKSAPKGRAAGTEVRQVSRPAMAVRSFPQADAPAAAAPAPLVALPAAAPVPAPACTPNPCCDPCAGGRCCIPPPAFCDPCAGGKCCVPPPPFCDPCAGGRCGVPEPAFCR